MTATGIATVLTDEQAWELLGTEDLGRLATTTHDGRTDVYPINYVTGDGLILIRTRPGSKLAELATFPEVVFETDRIDRETKVAWSVIVHATATIDRSTDALLKVEALGLSPLIETEGDDVVVLHPHEISARRFTLS